MYGVAADIVSNPIAPTKGWEIHIMRKLTTVFSAICAPLAAFTLGLSAMSPPVAAQTAPTTTTVRGTLRMGVTMAAVLGESSPEPGLFFLLIPEGMPDAEKNNYVIAAWALSLRGQKSARLAQEEGATCTFTLQERKPKPDWRVLNVSGCTPAPQ
jgi:hypothetical protein